jgi:hypothetical protein
VQAKCFKKSTSPSFHSGTPQEENYKSSGASSDCTWGLGGESGVSQNKIVAEFATVDSRSSRE